MVEKVTDYFPYTRLSRRLPFVVGLWVCSALCFFWSPLSPANAGHSSRIWASNPSEVVVAIPDTFAPPNCMLDIPILVSEASGIAGAKIKVTYDSRILTSLDVRKTPLTQDFVLVDSLAPGEISILLARATGLAAGGGKFVELAFQVNATALKGDTTTLTLATLLLYDENTNPIPATSISGLFTVDAPETVSVTPNPFTPNNDGFNDFVNFRFPEMLTQSTEILIFNILGKQVRRLAMLSGELCRWYGVDDGGRALEPGVYIYLIRSNGKQVADGTVTLMR